MITTETESPYRLEVVTERGTGIGGSEIAPICRLSPYSQPIDVWRAKVYGVSQLDNPYLLFGKKMEPYLANWYARETGDLLLEVPPFRHPDHSWMLGSFDRIISGKPIGVEIKTVNWHAAKKWGIDHYDIPMEYLCQVLWYLAFPCPHLNRDQFLRWDVVVWKGNGAEQYQEWLEVINRRFLSQEQADLAESIFFEWLVEHGQPYIHSILPDKAQIEQMIEIGRQFWFNHVVPKVPPPVDGSESWSLYLGELYAGMSAPGYLIPDQRSMPLIERLRKLKWIKKMAQSCEEEVKNKLKAMIKHHLGFIGHDFRITWKRGTTLKVDHKSLALSLHPTRDQVAEWTTEKPSESFTATFKDDGDDTEVCDE